MTGRQLKLNDFFNARHVAMAMPSTSTAVDDPLPQPSPEAEAMEEPQPQVPPSPVGRPRVVRFTFFPGFSFQAVASELKGLLAK